MSLFSKIRHFTTKLIMNWLNPEPEQQQTGTQITKPSSDDHIKVVYGERKIAGTIVFYNTTNPDDGDDVKNDLLHIIVVWCEGGIESIDDILLNDISITDSKFSAKKGGRWAYATHFTNGMGGYSDPHLKASGWDAATKDHRLDGLACSYIRLEWSLGDDTPFTGLPDLNAVIRGRKVKNLETGVTEYSENPAYCTLDYLTHPIFGKNLSASEYDLDSFKTAGLVAKTQVPEYQGASTTKPLFTCNLAIDTSASLLDNVELLGKSMRALMPIINGRLTLIIEQDEEPTEYGLSERDFKGSLKYDDGGKDKRYNRVIVEYIDKELSYSDQDAIYPEPDSELADQWLAEDNGVLLEYRFKVSSCNNYYEARQMARIIAMISRESLNFNVLCAPIAMRYTVGDVVPISHNKLGWDKKPFRLIKSVQQSTGQFLLTFREHQPYIYNWLSGVVRPPIPDTSLPDPRNVAEPVNFTSTLLNDGNVKINWESVYSHFDIQIYKNGTLLSTTTSVTPSFIISALDAGNYEMDVRAASKIGFRSAWVSFGFSVALPGVPVVNIDAVTYNTITLSASVTGASLGTTFEWQFLGQTAEPNTNPNTASGYNYIYTGLVPDTEYSFKVRTKNLSGVSPWVDVAVKTSLSDLLDYIDDIPLQKLSEDAQTLIEDINTQVDRLRPETEGNLPDLIVNNISEIRNLKNAGYQTGQDVTQTIDEFNSQYSITATLQQYDENEVLQKAIAAQQFIDGAEGFISDQITAFNAADGSVDSQFSNVDQQLNALTGKISQNIVQIQGLDIDLQNANLNDVITAANQLIKNNELAQQGVKLAIAQTELKANSSDIESLASFTLELQAVFNQSQAAFTDLSTVVANDKQALVAVEQSLTAKINNDTSAAVATAKEYTRTAVGYCVDENGEVTSENDAVQCVADGGSWVQGPLAEYISNLQISDGDSTASIKELKQVFKKVNGELVARGGWVLDNNGRAVSVAGYNDGETGNLDLVADVIRQGVMVGNTFVPTSYIDNTDPANPVHTFKGRMVLGDGTAIENAADIQAQAGGRGGVYYVGTSTGAWNDSTANSAVPGNTPINGDVVNIYKTSNPNVNTTKKYTGSAWESYALEVNGAIFATGSIDGQAFRAGTRIESPRIDLIGGSFMKIEYAPGFGPDNLWYWYGPRIEVNGLPDLDSLTKVNATEWKDTSGNGYFGGSIVAGTYSTALTTTDLSADAFVEIGPFGSNGGVINIVCSLQFSSRATGSSTNEAPQPSAPEYTITLSEYVGTSWVVRQTQSYTGEGRILVQTFETEDDKWHWVLQQTASGSFTYTDNKQSTVDRTYKLAITRRVSAAVNVGSYQNPSQKLSIISQED
ncbi:MULTISPECIES: hypothetical protein [unclassified Pseudoalteromonas]|uniref:hypothetical protein n=1 Tax=unclassified Pseudoalteromonas TaxID=194690 RepID=UPI0015FAEA6A|nr:MULTISPECIES: hypothetical protein [unclassified Pseudoalteromonas]MBB1291023.1 hypothetical protein [Pseudoalteromonas sp. SR41-5]MBB1415351.1 hypothetical protein [Pseudoalteromonas sp. SG43-8]